MGSFGGFYKGEKKKISKEEKERIAKRIMFQTGPSGFVLPKIIERKKT